jgi:Pentapeptide repeats (9 copies)
VAGADEEGRKGRPVARALGALGTILFLAGFVWLWWRWVPVLYQGFNGITQAERLTAITNTRAALLAGLVGIGALGTFWLNSRAQQFTAETLRVSQQTLRITERGHLTDRYTKAIEQLGGDKLDVRLGGIYALEQLATESPNDRDQATIVEVLSAFVREHSAPLYQYRQHRAGLGAAPEELDAERLNSNAQKYVRELREPPADVSTAVLVLGRLPRRLQMPRAALDGSYLRKIKIKGADVSGASFEFAKLGEASFNDSTLEDVSFTAAEAEAASLEGCSLRNSTFMLTNLSKANLTNADSGAPSSVVTCRYQDLKFEERWL